MSEEETGSEDRRTGKDALAISAAFETPPSPGRPSLGIRMLDAVRYGNTVVLTLLALLVAMAVGAVLIAVADPQVRNASQYFFSAPMDTLSAVARAVGGGYAALFQGAIYNPATASKGTLVGIFGPISETLVNATPLILGGLSVGLAFRAGLFNIGGQGQPDSPGTCRWCFT